MQTRLTLTILLILLATLIVAAPIVLSWLGHARRGLGWALPEQGRGRKERPMVHYEVIIFLIQPRPYPTTGIESK
jgi:hypothetical protein